MRDENVVKNLLTLRKVLTQEITVLIIRTYDGLNVLISVWP